MNGAEVQALVERLRDVVELRQPTEGWPFLMLQAAQCIEGYQRALSAHHELSTLSEGVIREWAVRNAELGGGCPVCARAAVVE